MRSLSGKGAVVTGASRGLGRGIALGLGEAGATVYVTGRSTSANRGQLPGTIEETAEELTRMGGRGIAVRCDHRVDSDVEAVFARVREEEGRLDLLVNNATAPPDLHVLFGGQRFWQIPVALWDDLVDVGVRSHFVATKYAAPTMIEQRSGLVINVSSHAAGGGKSAKSMQIVPYSVGKAALHRLTADMAVELQESGVRSSPSGRPPARRMECSPRRIYSTTSPTGSRHSSPVASSPRWLRVSINSGCLAPRLSLKISPVSSVSVIRPRKAWGSPGKLSRSTE